MHLRKFCKGLANYNIANGGVLLILLIITLLPFCILSFYNHPCADDYAITNTTIQKGFIETQKWCHNNWGGRYFYYMLNSINPLVLGPYWAYKLNSVILLLLLVTATYWVSGKLFPTLDKKTKIGIISLFIFSYIILMPDVAEGIFWQANSYACFVPTILTIVLLGCIVSYYQSSRFTRTWYAMLACLLAIAIIGSYEIHMVFADMIILLITFFNIAKRGKLIFPVTLLLICIIFSIIEITAPGNSVRASTESHNTHNLLFSLNMSVRYGKVFLIHWLPFMILIGLALSNLSSNQSNNLPPILFSIPPWLVLSACLMIPFLGVFIPSWATGLAPALRTVNVSCFYFVTGMMYFSFSSIAYIKKLYPDFILPVYYKIAFIFLLLFFSNHNTSIIRKNNIVLAYKDLFSGTALAYNRERTERHEFLLRFKGDSCILNSIKNIPSSLYFNELPPPERTYENWMNVSFEEYYHKKYIGIKGVRHYWDPLCF